jgi:hypothetical protein
LYYWYYLSTYKVWLGGFRQITPLCACNIKYWNTMRAPFPLLTMRQVVLHHWWWFCREQFFSHPGSLWSELWWHWGLLPWTNNHSEEQNSCNHLHSQHHWHDMKQVIVPNSSYLRLILLPCQAIMLASGSHSQGSRTSLRQKLSKHCPANWWHNT